MKMKIFKHINRLNLLDTLISQKSTGTPIELANRLDISLSHLARIIDGMKEAGAPISFNRKRKSYYYTSDYSIRIKVEIEGSDLQYTTNVSGGTAFFEEIPAMLFLSNERD